jgi:predicted ATPase
MEPLSNIIQKYLRASGHVQHELAREVGLHPKVLSRKVNRNGEARLNHQEIKGIIKTLAAWHAITSREQALQLLAAAGVEAAIMSDADWQALPLRSLAGPSAPLFFHASAASQQNLPPAATRLIGREQAVTRLRRLLERADVRLITLVGAGGSGKTRLALHVAAEVVSSFVHGVWFVALATARDAAEVPVSILQAMNTASRSDQPSLQQLIAYLRNKHLLLVLDNVEQITGITALLDRLLTQAPAIKMLVTSRAVLHIYGECAFDVPPLDVPALQNRLKAADILSFPAIQLFAERAQALRPDFAVSDENAGAIAQICARVDGLPLALELAAARSKLLSPAELLERLSQARLPLLTGGPRNLPDRQQTLRNTITWSYRLLAPEEQVWFRRLGIFTGPWSLEAAEAMMRAMAGQPASPSPSGPFDGLDMLERLVDNSLLVRLPVVQDRTYFILLETLREYALEELAAHGEIEALRDWHACYYLQLAEASVQGLRGPRQLAWLAHLTQLRENFRAAFQWLLQSAREGRRIDVPAALVQQSPATDQEAGGKRTLSAVELCLRLATAFRPYWEWKGYLNEGRSWLIDALDLPFEQEAERSLLVARAWALSEAARLVDLQNDLPRATELAEASISLSRQLGETRGLASALLHRGWVAHAQGDFETARRVYREGLQQLPAELDPWLHAELLFHLGDIEGQSFNFEQMHLCFARSKELFEQVGDSSALADLLKDQGGLLILESKYDESIASLLQSLRLCHEMDHRQFIATGLGWLSFAVGLRAQPDAATASIHSARIGGAAEALMDAIGLTPWTKTYPLTLVARQLLRQIVGDQRWEEAWQQGRSLTFEQTLALAYRLGEM